MNKSLGTIGTADGSALVRLGGTTVITGVKAEVGEAALSMPGQGFVVPNVHYAAGATAQTRPGPPSEAVQALTARVKTALDSLGLIDLKSLQPLEGLIWTLYVDIAVLNDDGNVWDALWLSLVSALEDTLLPELELDTEAGVVSIKFEAQTPLQLRLRPLPLSYAHLKDKDCLLADPSAAETALMPITNLLVARAHPETVLLASSPTPVAADMPGLAQALLTRLGSV